MKKLLLVGLLLLWSACGTNAADLEKNDYIESQVKFFKSQRIFPDWEGIVFTCDINEDTPLQKKVCQTFSRNLKQLCASQKISLHVIDPAISSSFLQSLKVRKDNLMPLKLIVRTNDVREDEPTAIYAELRSGLWFRDAVSAEDVVLDKKNRPRAGDLVMYSDYLIGIGLAGEMAPSVNAGLEKILQQFIDDFKKNNKEHLKLKKKVN